VNYPRFNNVHVFCVCLAALYFWHGVLSSYTTQAVVHMGKRYPIAPYEQSFIRGVEQAGFIAFLLIVSFFGNRMHRPITVGIGSLLAGFGCFLVAMPYWVYGSLPARRGGPPSPYLQYSDCAVNANETSGTQCDHLASVQETFGTPFTLICLGQFLIGTGGALYTALGIVHVEENAKKEESVLMLGCALAMYGLGQMVGTLVATNTLGMAEDSSSFVVNAAMEELVGAWWLAYPICGVFILGIGIVPFFFTKWFKAPEWRVRRKSRMQERKSEKDRRRISRIKSSQKRKSRPSSRNDSQAKNGPHHKLSHRNSQTRTSAKRSSSRKKKHRGMDKSKAHHGSKESLGSQHSLPSLTGAVDVIRALPQGAQQPTNHANYDGIANNNPDVITSTQNGITNEALDVDITVDVASDVNVNGAVVNEGFQADCETANSTGDMRQPKATDQSSEPVPIKRISESRASRHKRIRRERQVKLEQEAKETQEKPQPAQNRPKRYIIRNEQCKDMPRHLWRLLRSPVLVTTLVGAVLSSFMFTGYMYFLPDYMHIAFHREKYTATVTTAFVGPLGWSVGVLSGAIIHYKMRLKPAQSLKLVVVSVFVCCFLQCILLACACEDLPVGIRQTAGEDLLVTSCNMRCDCEGLQYTPVCGEDGVTYMNPCTAACTQLHVNAGVNFTSCGCINGGGWATLGACTSSCALFHVYNLFAFMCIVVYGCSVMPVIMIFLREVFRDRYTSLSLGFSLWVIYLLGAVMGPPLYTWMRSTTCLYWSADCHDEDMCWHYDVTQYRYLLHGVTIILLLFSMLMYAAALFVVTRKKTTAVQKPEDVEAPQTDVNTIEQVVIEPNQL